MNIGKIISKWLSHTGIQSVTSATQDTDNANSLPSLDFAFDLVKERIDSQLARIDGLDSNANFISGAAIGILGIALTIQAWISSLPQHAYCTAFIPPLIHMLSPALKHAILITPLIATFIKVMHLSHSAYKLGEYKEVPANPEELYNYLEQDVIITKIDVFNRMKENFKTNENKIEEKARRIDHAFMWLNAEIASFLLLFLYQALC